jgi:alkanesulfonate monooxygenase SsuD/methylene tetrahydromethanopterin reductase-like flavin-dependent oxidoreductase (luciferase family)
MGRQRLLPFDASGLLADHADVMHARSMANRALVSIGVAASIGPELAAQLAPLVEDAGFHALWVNDTPGSDALSVLAAAAQATERLTLATGVLPLDRRSVAEIVGRVVGDDLPQHRLVLGLGSGQARVGGVKMVRDAASELRAALGARVVIGALGPKMRAAAVEASDGVLLSWLTPDVARQQAEHARERNVNTHVALYVRTALDSEASSRLRAETAQYAAFPSYAANLTRTGVDANSTVIDAAVHDGPVLLQDFRDGPDEIVLRAITPDDSLEDYQRFIDRARLML